MQAAIPTDDIFVKSDSPRLKSQVTLGLGAFGNREGNTSEREDDRLEL